MTIKRKFAASIKNNIQNQFNLLNIDTNQSNHDSKIIDKNHAFTKIREKINVTTAFDVDVIKCTGGCFVSKTLLHSTSPRSDNRQLMPELLHLIAIRLNGRWRLSDWQTAAPDRETTKCTLTVVCCENSLIRRFSRWNVKNCTRCWNRRMHWQFCLFYCLLLS